MSIENENDHLDEDNEDDEDSYGREVTTSIVKELKEFCEVENERLITLWSGVPNGALVSNEGGAYLDGIQAAIKVVKSSTKKQEQ